MTTNWREEIANNWAGVASTSHDAHLAALVTMMLVMIIPKSVAGTGRAATLKVCAEGGRKMMKSIMARLFVAL